MRFLAVLAMCTLLPAALSAAESTFSSGDRQIALLELYTSEGCSSCPPADRWLTGLRDAPGLWSDFVPIAFHVDYWNYIGWTDRFSEKSYSDRQRRYIREGAANVVYTPGFFSAGEEWLGWRNRKPIATDAPVVGELTARVEDETIAVRFAPKAVAKDRLVAHVVVLGMDLETEVRAGENRGRKLRHDFVVLDYQRVPLDTSGTGHKGTATLPLYTQETNALGVAVWVSDSDSQTPIQAVGGMLPGP